MAPVTNRTVWVSLEPELGPLALRWPKRCVSVPCAVTMPLATTTVCGPVRVARPSLRGASRVGDMSASSVCDHRILKYCLFVVVERRDLEFFWLNFM